MSRTALLAEALEGRMLLSVSLLKDINAGNLGSGPNEVAAAGAGVIFAAERGSQAWVSDGTEAGTALVPGLTMLGTPITFNGDAYFVGSLQSLSGLWKSDGTVAGTIALGTFLGSGPIGMVSAGDKFFMDYGDLLLSSDGTAAGTGTAFHMPQNFGVDVFNNGNGVKLDMAGSQGKACFVISDNPTTQRQVWVTDGTTSGTHLLLDQIGNSQALVAAAPDGSFYIFVAGGGRQGLYRSDGTPGGTRLISPVGGDPSLYNQLAVAGNEVYFTGSDPTNGTQLWQSDGTAAGTQSVFVFEHTTSTRPQFANFTPLNGTLLFDVDDRRSQGPWVVGGPEPIGPLHASVQTGANWPTFTVAGNEAFFADDDGTLGTQLWKTDGTFENTHLVANINPVGTSNPTNLTAAANGELFLSADDGIHGPELWKSNGTAGGTQLVKDIDTRPASSTPQDLIDVGGTLFFTATDRYGQQVWKSDGTAAGTVRVTDLNPDEPGTRGIQNLTEFNGSIYFTTGSGKLWKIDGTQRGASQILAVALNPFTAPIFDLTPAGNELFFLVVSGSDLQLWSTTGSAAGTFSLASWPGQSALNPGNSQLTPFDGGVVFQAISGSTPQLWHSDGTFAGTGPLTNLPALPVGAQLSSANLFASAGVVGNTFYFVDSETRIPAGSTQPVTVHDLWKTDGTPGGTVKLFTNFPLSPAAFFDVGGIPAFFATLSTPALWSLDPGTGSPTRVANLTQVPIQTAMLGGKLYFLPGAELWVTDGTSAGTRYVTTLPSAANANPGRMIAGGGTIFMNLGFGGLWRSDGTQGGTAPIVDAPSPSSPLAFAANRLFFSATDPSAGTELFAVDASVPGDVFNDANHDGIRQVGEAGIAGVTVFLDTNNNGVLDPGEPSTVTDADGNFAFDGLVPGNYTVRQVLPAGYVQTTPLPTISAAVIGDDPGRSFGDAPAASVPLDFSFLLKLAQHYDQSGSFAAGDLNGDGTINFDDLLILARNYGPGGAGH